MADVKDKDIENWINKARDIKVWEKSLSSEPK